MAVNEMLYNGEVYTRIRSAKCNKKESISLSSLPVDTLMVRVVDERHWNRLLVSKGDNLPIVFDGFPIASKLSKESLENYEYGTPILYRHDGNLVGKFYLEYIKQVGKWDWEFSCISDMGILLNNPHYGGLYEGAKFKDVVADVIEGLIPYSIHPDLEDVEVWGRLKKSNRRNNLRDLLYAVGAQVAKDENGDSVFQPYIANPKPYTVLPTKFYLSGGGVNKGTPATKALLTEHAFAKRDTDETVTLFDGEVRGDEIDTPNGLRVEGTIIDFSDPIYDLEVYGTDILESGVNYAVLANASYALLTGKKYTHTQRTLSRESNVQGIPNAVSSSTCELVNIRNSRFVADRLIAFYGYAKEVVFDMVLTDQKPGDFVSFIDSYGNPSTGYIQSLDISMSKDMKAKATVICGFIPPVDVPMYLHLETISADQDWVVPDGVESVQVVLIGGGPQGFSGGAGKPGDTTSKTKSGTDNRWKRKYAYRDASIGGDGGVPGTGAPGAKVFSTSLKVTAGQTFAVKIGVGGVGKAFNSSLDPVEGEQGTATTFGPFSSDSGKSIPGGYLETLSGHTYAKEGRDGLAGGKGVGVDPDDYKDDEQFSPFLVPPGITFGGITYVPGQDQTVTGTLINEGSRQYDSGTIDGEKYTDRLAWGEQRGPGGGAAVGRNGYDSISTSRTGGDGASPGLVPPAKTNPGDGGDGGYGGGGGGGFGGAGNVISRSGSITLPPPSGSLQQYPVGTPGEGGKGGPGGQGGPGLVLLYYYSPEPNEEEMNIHG